MIVRISSGLMVKSAGVKGLIEHMATLRRLSLKSSPSASLCNTLKSCLVYILNAEQRVSPCALSLRVAL